MRPEPPTYRRESQYTVYPEHPYKSDTWRTKQGRGQSVGVSDTPKHLASEDTQSRQDTGVIEEATTGRSQGRGVARTTGPGSVGGRPVPIQRVWDPSDSPGLKEKVRDLGRDLQVRDLRSQVRATGSGPTRAGPKGGSEPTRVRPDHRGSGTRPDSLGLKERVSDPSTDPQVRDLRPQLKDCTGRGPSYRAETLTHTDKGQGPDQGRGTWTQGPQQSPG